MAAIDICGTPERIAAIDRSYKLYIRKKKLWTWISTTTISGTPTPP